MTVPFFNYIEFSDTTQTISYGSGTPEGSLSASVGSLYLRDDGASGSIAYLKASGAGNTGWEAITTSGISGATILDELNDVNALNPADGEVLTYVGGSINEWQALEVDLSVYLPKSAGASESLTGPLYTNSALDTANVDIAFGAANTGLMKPSGLNGVDIVAGGVVGARIWDAGGGNILQTYSAFATTFDSSFLTSFTSPAAEFKGVTGGGGRCEFRFYENQNGSDYIAFLAPASIEINRIWTWPQAEIAEGQVWVCDSTSTATNGILINRLLVLDDISDFPIGTEGQVLTYVGGSINEWVAADPAAGGGSGITSLGGQTGSTQTFAEVNNGSNMTLTISSSGDEHTFTTAWTGDLAVVDGGTGQSTYTNGQLLIGNTTGNTLAKSTLTAGTGIGVSNGNGSITLSVSGLTVSEFSSANISQWTNNSNYFDTAGSGLTSSTSTVNVGSGSGIAVNANDVALDINSLSTETTIANDDFVPFWDITVTATNKKITFANFKTAVGAGSFDIDGLTSITVADVSSLGDYLALADTSDSSATRKILVSDFLTSALKPTGGLRTDTAGFDEEVELDFSNLPVGATLVNTDLFAFYDTSCSVTAKVTFEDLASAISGASLFLGDITDVDATLPEEGSVLVYQGGSSDIWSARPTRGTSFPLNPDDGDNFYRTDLEEEFYYVASRDKWLSTNTSVYEFGNNATYSAVGYIRYSNDVIGPLRGPLVPWDYTIIGVALRTVTTTWEGTMDIRDESGAAIVTDVLNSVDQARTVKNMNLDTNGSEDDVLSLYWNMVNTTTIAQVTLGLYVKRRAT